MLNRLNFVKILDSLFCVVLVLGFLSLPSLASDSDSIEAYAKTLALSDPKGNNDLRATSVGSVATPFGTVIDSSCLGRFETRSQKSDYINSINLALLQAFTGTQTCANSYEIDELKTVISILRRSVLECKGLPAGVYARNTIVKTLKVDGQPDQFVTTNFDQSWTILISSSDFNNEDDRKQLATSLFHEAFHSTASNNRTVPEHNSNANREITGCENSFYNDRVYFATAVCFPTTMSVTRYFWSIPGLRDGNAGPFDFFGPASCGNVCKEALTQVSQKIAESFGNARDAETIVAKPYTSDKVESVCNKIKDQMNAAAVDRGFQKATPPCIIGGTIYPPQTCPQH